MRFITLFIILSWIGSASAQLTRTDLENDRLEIIKQIETTQQRLTKAEANKESTLSKINAIERQIDARNALIANLQKDASLSTETIAEVSTVKEETTKTNSALIEDYNKLLRIRYRNKLLNKNLSALYNTEQLNELITKWKYLKSYESMLSGKSLEINKLDQKVESLSANIETETTNHTSLIERETIARDSLVTLMKQLTYLATSMSSKEKAMKQMLAEQTRTREQFNQAIESTIFSSLGRTPPTASTLNNAVVQRMILDKKGFLPWPLESATLITRYGPQPHPTVSGIIVDNKGIDLSAASNTVSAIFEGEVISIAQVKGSGITIIIKHQGDIYSVYSNMDSVLTQKDATVEQGAAIGLARSDANGRAKIHFELYQGKQNLNPNHWLKNN